MNLSVGIVGLPNVGKSTLFQALTKKPVDIANYPFCTIEPNVGIVKVEDERLHKLGSFFQSQKIIPAVIEFVDIAGLVRGANKGEGLGNKFLSHIREVKAIVQVVRCFENKDIIHVDQEVDALRDIETINTELLLKDLETVGNKLWNVERDVRGQKKEAAIEKEILENVQASLNKGVSALRFLKEQPEADEVLHDLQLLTAKPVVYVFNTSSDTITKELQRKVEEIGATYVTMNIRDELDAAGLSIQEAQELGVEEQKLPELIGAAYKSLGLITFFTTGPDETRSWTIQEGTKAPQAGAVIHSDFEEKFIRAAVIQWNKLLEAGGVAEAAAKGWLRMEGKEYVVADGDVLEIKHGA